MRNLVLSCLLLGGLLTGLTAQPPLSTSAQEGPGRLNMGPPAGKLQLSSLLDPARFSMQHSYTVSFSSDGKNSFYNGLYLNTMQYRVTAPLTLRLKWGLYQVPQAGNATHYGINRNNLVVPGVELLYHPSENFLLKIQYSNFYLPAMGSPFYRSLE